MESPSLYFGGRGCLHLLPCIGEGGKDPETWPTGGIKERCQEEPGVAVYLCGTLKVWSSNQRH